MKRILETERRAELLIQNDAAEWEETFTTQSEQFTTHLNSLYTHIKEEPLSSLLQWVQRLNRWLIRKSYALFQKKSADVEPLILQKEKKLIQEIEKLHNKYQTLFANELALVVNNRTSEARKVYRGEGKKIFDQLNSTLESAITLFEKNTSQIVKQTTAFGQFAEKFVFYTSAIIFFIGILIGSLMAYSISRPIKNLKTATEQIKKGQYDVPVKINSKDEVQELAKAFNSMAKRLGELEKLKSEFISSMTHDLKSPLASIQQATNLMIEGIPGETNDDQKKLLQIILGNTQRQYKLIDDILDTAKLESGITEIHAEQADVIKLLKQSLVLLTPLAKEKHITLVTRIAENIPEINVDHKRIGQVFTNLVGNAIHHSPQQKRITVEVRNFEEALEFRVIDEGPGIPANMKNKIFEKFQQVKGRHNPKGTGLGLTITKLIVEAHGGKIWIESEEGVGSSFCFTIPK